MRRRNIQNTDLNALICLGALPFGLSVDADLAFALMNRFFATGAKGFFSRLQHAALDELPQKLRFTTTRLTEQEPVG